MRNDCILDSDAYGRGSVMVWGGISIGGRTDLAMIDENLTAQRYVDEIHWPYVLPYAVAIGNGFTLQNNKAWPPRGRIANAFVEDKGIHRMEWLVLSTDFNLSNSCRIFWEERLTNA